jgi:predicted ArsR family transcriptional regulator
VDIPATGPANDLAPGLRRQLLAALAGLRRPATTQELAGHVGRHPNTVRTQLQRLERNGLLECRITRQARGRPRHEWAIAADARPGGAPPEAHGQLARWLARALDRPPGREELERLGREIGRELAPASGGRPLADAMQDALTALGFSPRLERPEADRLRHVLRNCPYREAARENPAAICTLHRGIATGLLDRLQRDARLTGFVAKDPYAAGCLIEVTAAGPEASEPSPAQGGDP